ncbi:hypothetical protein GINT2_001253 [Glugoides intestinalis]
MSTKDFLYHITEQDRMATLFWSLNSLRMLKDSLFDKLKPAVIQFIFSCLNENGGFSPNPRYTPNIIATFNALQILYIYEIPYYNRKTVEYILSLQNLQGAFIFDEYGDIDTRFDCCGILSLYLLLLMKDICPVNELELVEYTEHSRLHFSNEIKFDFCKERALQEESHLVYKLLTGKPLGFRKISLKSQIEKGLLKEIGFKVEESLNHLLSCINYDGGIGQIPGSESHAAQVFCVVSALHTLGCLEMIDRLKTIDFLMCRQLENGGLNGRVNKKEDVCYSFWAFAALVILEAEYIDLERLYQFILSCQDENGGFSDRPGNQPDVYHLMFSLASISLLGKGLHKVDPRFAI